MENKDLQEQEIKQEKQKKDCEKKVYLNKLFGSKTYKKKKEETNKEKKRKEKYIKPVTRKERTKRESTLREILERQKREKEEITSDPDYDEKLDQIKVDKDYDKTVEFNYLSKKEFKKLKKDDNVEIEIIGHFSPKREFKDDQDDVLRIKNFAFDVREKKKGRTAGYVVVEDEKYYKQRKEEQVNTEIEEFNRKKPYQPLTEEEDALIRKPIKVIRYYKKSLYPFFLLLLLLLLLVGTLWMNRSRISDITGIELDDLIDWDKDKNKENSKEIKEQTVIPGFVSMTVEKSDPYVQLGNPKQNTVYFVYKIYDTKSNKLVYSTKGIEPGKAVNWDPYNQLKAGEYELQISIEAYDLETMRACNGANQKMTLTIK